MVATVFDALMTSSPVVCLALAYGIIYGVLGLMDLTLSTRFAAAAYAGWWLANRLYPQTNPTLNPALWIAAMASALMLTIGTWALLVPLTRRSPLVLLVGSLGILSLTQAGFQGAFGTAPRVFTGYPAETGIPLLGTAATRLQLLSAGYTLFAVVATAFILHKTRFGDRLRTVAEDPEVARGVFGLDVERLTWQAVLFAGLLVAPAGLLHGIGSGVAPGTGSQFGLLAFVATIVAGRRRPLAAAIVALALALVGTLSTRWTFVEATVCLVVAGGVVFTVRKLCPPLPFGLQTVAAGLALILAVAISDLSVASVSENLPVKISTLQIPSAYQPLIPYLVIVAALLWRPHGIFADLKQRTV
jgi:branched-subunit amino acid ABC-type transport system permease component